MESFFLFAATLTISLTGLVIVLRNSKTAADRDYVNDLAVRVKSAEDRLLECEKARAELARENLNLMRQVLKLPLDD